MREFKKEEAERLARVVREVMKISHRILVKRALQKRRVFNSLKEHLDVIKRGVCGLDPDAEVYLFGSVAEGRK